MAAKLFAIDDVPVGFRNHLLASLRGTDEAILLPGSSRNEHTGVIKNAVFRLSGSDPNVPIDILNERWFTGVSAVKIECPRIEAMMRSPDKRAEALQRLRDAIPTEMANASISVGPPLDCDEHDCDVAAWTAGFDTPGCFVGLFSAEHSVAPEPGKRGMNRVHSRIFLVCKAGAGLAGATFHARLTAALRKGLSLDAALDATSGEPGPAALRRVSMAGSRNRARILMAAGNALGIPMMDSVPDQSSKGKYRCAVTHVDVQCNTLRKIDEAHKSTWQYTTGADTTVSAGLITLSNVADGVLLMLSSNGELKVPLRNNETFSAIPYSSTRLREDKDVLLEAVQAHREAKKTGEVAHIDDAFVRERFAWKNRTLSDTDVDIEPLALWGSYSEENWVARFARELAIDSCQFVRLRPNLVCLAGMEPGKLRAAQRSIAA